MEPKTAQHLLAAQRNRNFAEGALADPDLLPVLRQWGAVAAFYSAVQYVNAYLFERQRFEPQNHRARREAIAQALELRVYRHDYRQLNDTGYQARYDPMYEVTDAWLKHLIEVHLRRIGDDITSLLAPRT